MLAVRVLSQGGECFLDVFGGGFGHLDGVEVTFSLAAEGGDNDGLVQVYPEALP